MKLFRRSIAWSCFLGMLTAVGLGVFQFVRYRPRCTIEGKYLVQRLSANGRRLILNEPLKNESGRLKGFRIHVCDARTGRFLRSLETSQGMAFAVSRDSRLLLAVGQRGAVRFVDWQADEEWSVPLGAGDEAAHCGFSPNGQWLRVSLAGKPNGLVIDVTARQIAHRLDEPLVYSSVDDCHVLRRTADGRLRVIDLPTGRTLTILKVHNKPEHVLSGSGNGRYIALGAPGSGAQRRYLTNAFANHLEIWDLVDARRIWPRATGEPVDKDEIRYIALADHNPLLATWTEAGKERRLEFIDMSDGRLRMSTPITSGHGVFFADDSLFLFQHDFEKKTMVFDAVAGKLLWEKPGDHTQLIGSDRVLWWHEHDRGIEVLDARSGTSQHVFPLDYNVKRDPVATSNGRFVGFMSGWPVDADSAFLKSWLNKLLPAWFDAKQHRVVIADVTIGREVFRLHQSHIDAIYLSDDGRTLVTEYLSDRGAMSFGIEHDRVLRVWDVHPHRAYFWAIVWPLLIGGTLLLLRRWRANRKPAAASRTVSVTPKAVLVNKTIPT